MVLSTACASSEWAVDVGGTYRHQRMQYHRIPQSSVINTHPMELVHHQYPSHRVSAPLIVINTYTFHGVSASLINIRLTTVKVAALPITAIRSNPRSSLRPRSFCRRIIQQRYVRTYVVSPPTPPTRDPRHPSRHPRHPSQSVPKSVPARWNPRSGSISRGPSSPASHGGPYGPPPASTNLSARNSIF